MKPCIVWQTDFTLKWGAVASMRGVCMQVDPTLECVDITHEIEPYNILAASREIMYVEPFWPKGTIFVSVVDPGVGTSRKACVAKLKDGNYIVTPDNGTLTHLFYNVGIEEVREIDESINRYKGEGTEGVSVFHGRDIFAYVAARLASGVITFEEVGPAYDVNTIIREEERVIKAKIDKDVVEGIVSSVSDPFGSIVFNITTADFNAAGNTLGDQFEVTICHEGKQVYQEVVPYAPSFGYVPEKAAVLFNSSTTYISLGLNMDSFRDVYHIGEGIKWSVVLRKVGKGVEM